MILGSSSRRASLAVASLFVLAVSAFSVGCEKKDDDEKSGSSAAPIAPAPPPPPPQAPAAPAPAAPTPAAPAGGDVTRYPDESPLTGGANVSNDVSAHKQASQASEIVQAIARGSAVTKVARSGLWTLISWKQTTGDKMGWVESAKAFNDRYEQRTVVPQQVIDEGRRRGVLRPR